jgi:hypothetical protein
MSTTTFLSLPAELRIQIATYALEQSEDVIASECREDRLDSAYVAASNLSILLVCRRCQRDFKNLAYQKTTFVLTHHTMQAIHQQPVANLQNLRKLVIESNLDPIAMWHKYPLDNESLHLDELCIVTSDHGFRLITGLLRRLRNVKTLRIFPTSGNPHMHYAYLVGIMQKADHYQRYDAPDAPDIGYTWWDPCYNAQAVSFDLVAQDPVPLMDEEDYMIMMKTQTGEFMEWVAKWL